MGEAALKSTAAGLKPGVVTGDDYVTLVESCKAGGYARNFMRGKDSPTVRWPRFWARYRPRAIFT